MTKTREPIVLADHPTPKVDGGGVAFSLRTVDYKAGQCVMTYQTTAGALTPGAHPGSYNGQDAYNDMLVTDDGIMHGNRTSERRNHEGGGVRH